MTWQALLKQAQDLRDRTAAKDYTDEDRYPLYHELARAVVRLADDPAWKAATDAERGGSVGVVANELLRHVPLCLLTARNLLRKIPDPAGCMFSTDIEFYEVARHAHYDDADAYFRVHDALEAFGDQDFAFMWRPSDDIYLEHDYDLNSEAHATAVTHYADSLRQLENCRPPDWLMFDTMLRCLARHVRPLVRRLKRSRDLFTARAIVILIEKEVTHVREEIERCWPRDDEVEDALREDREARTGER
jgi:hypothetical protein